MENDATPLSPAAATCAQKSVCQSVTARLRTGVVASLICQVPSTPPDSEPLDVIVPAVLLFEVDNVIRRLRCQPFLIRRSRMPRLHVCPEFVGSAAISRTCCSPPRRCGRAYLF